MTRNPSEIKEDDFSMIESFVVRLNCRTSETFKVNELRQILYFRGKDIENIPPTEAALKEHIRRPAY